MSTHAKGEEMNEKMNEQWLDEVRKGGLAYISHVRRLLLSAPKVVIEGDERQGLLDFLEYTEDHLVSMWELVAEAEREEAAQEEAKQLTERATERVRQWQTWDGHV